MRRVAMRILLRIVLAGVTLASLVPFVLVAPAFAATAPSPSLATNAAPRRIALMPPRTSVQSGYARRAQKPLGRGSLLWGGGPVQHNPSAYVIFWGASWEAGKSTGTGTTTTATLIPAGQLVQKYFADVGGSALERILTQYHDNSGPVNNTSAVAAMLIDSSVPPTDATCGSPTIQDSAIQQEIVAVAQKLQWPAPSADATYFVYTPTHYFVNDGTGACSQTVFCAYHAWSQTTPGFAYATIPYPDTAGCQIPHSPNKNVAGDSLVSTTSHEQFESITDPQVGSGWIDAASYEIADKCIWDLPARSILLKNKGHFAAQAEYSNASRTCVFSYTPPAPKRRR